MIRAFLLVFLFCQNTFASDGPATKTNVNTECRCKKTAKFVNFGASAEFPVNVLFKIDEKGNISLWSDIDLDSRTLIKPALCRACLKKIQVFEESESSFHPMD